MLRGWAVDDQMMPNERLHTLTVPVNSRSGGPTSPVQWLLAPCVALTLSFPSALLAQPLDVQAPESPIFSDAAIRVSALANDVLEVARLPALSVAILEPDADGKLVVAYSEAFGYADLAAETEADSTTRFRAASVSKLITVTTLARMVVAGDIDWDTELSSLGLEFPTPAGITPRRLAGHLAGIGHYHGKDRIARWEQSESAVAALAAFRNSPRAGQPGEQYKYSTHGYSLLSAMMEVAADKTFPEIVEERLAAPLGLLLTGAAPAVQGEGGMATLYMVVRAGPSPLPRPENPSYKWAGGGMATTPSDLVKMASIYLQPGPSQPGHGFLPQTVIDEMWTPQSVAGSSTGVGIGWRIGTESEAGRKIVHHSGSMQGARSTLILFPEERRAIALMTNAAWDSDVERTGALLMEAWRGDESPSEDEGQTGSVARLPSGTVSYTIRLTPSGAASTAASAEAGTSQEAFEDVSGQVMSAGTGRLGGLKAPDGFSQITRAPVVDLRLVHIASDRWTLATPRGLARGTCSGGEDAVLDCRFELSRTYDVVVKVVGPEEG